jgi:N-glycosylase/DNA lyase
MAVLERLAAGKVERAVLKVCGLLESSNARTKHWSERNEEEFAFDVALCVAGSQTRFEEAEASAGRLRRRGLLNWLTLTGAPGTLRSVFLEALLPPKGAELAARPRGTRLRFPRRTATLLASTVELIRGAGRGIGEVLGEASSPRDARKRLIRSVAGFGPKQASLFLRRVGFTADLAVLDRHVLTYLRLCHGIEVDPRTLGHVGGYEAAEARFVRVARAQGVTVGNYDLAVWVTMRVAREERVL